MAAITTMLMGAAMVGGLGMTAYGTIKQTQAAKEQARLQKDMTAQELRMEADRKKMMELDARRKQLEALRQGQRARALALTAATNQGAGFGTGLLGGYGQIAGQTGANLLGISQGLELGRNMFDINAQMNQTKIAMAGAAGAGATGMGLMTMGGNLMRAAPYMNNLFMGFGKQTHATEMV